MEIPHNMHEDTWQTSNYYDISMHIWACFRHDTQLPMISGDMSETDM
jgi:hypothetical protein